MGEIIMVLIGADRMKALENWKARMSAEHFFVPRGKGALWSGIGPSAVARHLAFERDLTTLELTSVGNRLDKGDLKIELDRDFGPGWNAEKREVFKALSKRFSESLTGLVTMFLPEGMARPANGTAGSFAYAVKILWDELRDNDFGDPRIVVRRVDAIRILWVSGMAVKSETLMSASTNIH